MDRIQALLNYNHEWADQRKSIDAEIFKRQSDSQAPEFLWIGCADSRVPATQITGAQPGEMFVHRNIANSIPDGDVSSGAVIQYAVAVLKVKHIIVCGHYGCGGVKAALGDALPEPLESWVKGLRIVRDQFSEALDTIEDDDARWARFCELNVAAQVNNVARLDVVKDAWQRAQTLTIHGWIYDLSEGQIKDLGISVSAAE